jgi:hypothetical protein
LADLTELIAIVVGSPAPAWVREWTDDHNDDHLVDLRAAASRSAS